MIITYKNSCGNKNRFVKTHMKTKNKNNFFNNYQNRDLGDLVIFTKKLS